MTTKQIMQKDLINDTITALVNIIIRIMIQMIKEIKLTTILVITTITKHWMIKRKQQSALTAARKDTSPKTAGHQKLVEALIISTTIPIST